MKSAALIGFSLITSLFASNSFGQSWQRHVDDKQTAAFSQEHGAPTTLFARYVFQPASKRSLEPWQMGVSFALALRSERFSFGTQQIASKTSAPLELRFGGNHSGLWSAGTNGRLIADFAGSDGILSATQGNATRRSGVGNALLIGGAVIGVIVLAAALSSDNEPLLCTGNTVPNPIAGTCEPIR